MQGIAKIEVKILADEREYNFFFPQNAHSDEVIKVCESLLNDFKELKKKSSEEVEESGDEDLSDEGIKEEGNKE